jgi:hypothetical protein
MLTCYLSRGGEKREKSGQERERVGEGGGESRTDQQRERGWVGGEEGGEVYMGMDICDCTYARKSSDSEVQSPIWKSR